MPTEPTEKRHVWARGILIFICLAYVGGLTVIATTDRARENPKDPLSQPRDASRPCTPPDDAALKDNLEQVKLLFDYSKFHISVYTTLAGFLLTLSASGFVKKWELHRGFLVAAVFIILAAGMAAGIVAASMPQSTSKLDFWFWSTGPYDSQWLTIQAWTHVEHTSFWIAVVLVIGAFFAGRASRPADWTAALVVDEKADDS